VAKNGRKVSVRRQDPAGEEVVEGSDNVFADLGLPDAAELLLKGKLTLQLHHRIKELGLTQVQAARRLGISQPEVCRLLKGRFTGFSAERLIGLLNALELDVEIVIRPRSPQKRAVRRGRVRVVEAAV
jgi:predicted XRE-type DNA-binding protein